MKDEMGQTEIDLKRKELLRVGDLLAVPSLDVLWCRTERIWEVKCEFGIFFIEENKHPCEEVEEDIYQEVTRFYRGYSLTEQIIRYDGEEDEKVHAMHDGWSVIIEELISLLSRRMADSAFNTLAPSDGEEIQPRTMKEYKL